MGTIATLRNNRVLTLLRRSGAAALLVLICLIGGGQATFDNAESTSPVEETTMVMSAQRVTRTRRLVRFIRARRTEVGAACTSLRFRSSTHVTALPRRSMEPPSWRGPPVLRL